MSKFGEWVNRKHGRILVWKERFGDSHLVTSDLKCGQRPVECYIKAPDNRVGCGHPCIFCRKNLEKYNLSVITFFTENLDLYSGKMRYAPPSKLTGKQKSMVGAH